MYKKTLSLIALAVAMSSTTTVTHAASTVFESKDMLTSAEALGRFQWLEKCYSGILEEIADNIINPTNPIPKAQKFAQLKDMWLYDSQGQLRANANYLTFGDETWANPKRWYAGKSPTEQCFQIPSDYAVTALLVSSPTKNYCNAEAREKTYEHIKRVKINGLDNASDDSYYSNFVGQVVKVLSNKTYTLELEPGFSSSETFPETWHVWFDWNQDGDFSDSGESYYVGVSDKTITKSVKVPANAAKGVTKMRVSMDYLGGSPDACKDVDSGEVEDYMIYIK